jgi:ribonuclease HI
MNFQESDYIFTDGATLNNGLKNAKGGIGVFFKNNDKRNYYNKLPKKYGIATNNKCEMYAILKAFEIYFECYERDILKKTKIKNLIIFSDSNYTIKSLSIWINKWRFNNWKTISGTDVKNRDLIEIIDYYINRYSKYINIIFLHVKAHTKSPNKINKIEYFKWNGNNKADKLAKKGRDL